MKSQIKPTVLTSLAFFVACNVSVGDDPDITHEICMQNEEQECYVDEAYCSDFECYDPYPGHHENWCPGYSFSATSYGANEFMAFTEVTDEIGSQIGSYNLKEEVVECGQYVTCKDMCVRDPTLGVYYCVPKFGLGTVIKSSRYQALDYCLYEEPDYDE